jgi:hypothetical protein
MFYENYEKEMLWWVVNPFPKLSASFILLFIHGFDQQPGYRSPQKLKLAYEKRIDSGFCIPAILIIGNPTIHTSSKQGNNR